MKRPSKQDPPTTERILNAAGPLFYRLGLGAVTLDEIAAAAGMTKRTLYYHFSNKDELILAYLQRWRARTLEALTVAEGERSDPIRRLLAAFRRLEKDVERSDYRGCPMVNAVSEIHDRAHPATALAAAYKEDRRAWFEKLLREAGIASAAKLSRELMVVWDGGMVRALITGSAGAIREAHDAAAALIEASDRG